jgi:hypothetical protein
VAGGAGFLGVLGLVAVVGAAFDLGVLLWGFTSVGDGQGHDPVGAVEHDPFEVSFGEQRHDLDGSDDGALDSSHT